MSWKSRLKNLGRMAGAALGLSTLLYGADVQAKSPAQQAVIETRADVSKQVEGGNITLGASEMVANATRVKIGGAHSPAAKLSIKPKRPRIAGVAGDVGGYTGPKTIAALQGKDKKMAEELDLSEIEFITPPPVPTKKRAKSGVKKQRSASKAVEKKAESRIPGFELESLFDGPNTLRAAQAKNKVVAPSLNHLAFAPGPINATTIFGASGLRRPTASNQNVDVYVFKAPRTPQKNNEPVEVDVNTLFNESTVEPQVVRHTQPLKVPEFVAPVATARRGLPPLPEPPMTPPPVVGILAKKRADQEVMDEVDAGWDELLEGNDSEVDFEWEMLIGDAVKGVDFEKQKLLSRTLKMVSRKKSRLQAIEKEIAKFTEAYNQNAETIASLWSNFNEIKALKGLDYFAVSMQAPLQAKNVTSILEPLFQSFQDQFSLRSISEAEYEAQLLISSYDDAISSASQHLQFILYAKGSMETEAIRLRSQIEEMTPPKLIEWSRDQWAPDLDDDADTTMTTMTNDNPELCENDDIENSLDTSENSSNGNSSANELPFFDAEKTCISDAVSAALATSHTPESPLTAADLPSVPAYDGPIKPLPALEPKSNSGETSNGKGGNVFQFPTRRRDNDAQAG